MFKYLTSHHSSLTGLVASLVSLSMFSFMRVVLFTQFQAKKGESLGGFNHMRTLMTHLVLVTGGYQTRHQCPHLIKDSQALSSFARNRVNKIVHRKENVERESLGVVEVVGHLNPEICSFEINLRSCIQVSWV